MCEIENNKIYKELLIEKKNLPHFFIVFGDIKNNKKIVKFFLDKELKIKTKKNINFIELDFDIFKIDDAKKILKLQSNKKTKENKQYFIITAKDINIYTQNALLKTFEEPVKNTHFFIFLESDFKILPTLLSRARILTNYYNNFSELFLNFLESNFLEREKIIKDIENTRDKIKLIYEFENFFLKEKKNIFIDKYNFSNEEIWDFENKLLYLKEISQTEGVSVSNVLNYLSIKFPIIKNYKE